jgi:hypothetical protein
MNADKPDFKLLLFNTDSLMKEMLKSLKLLAFGDAYYGDKIKMQLTQLIVMLFKQIIHY